MTKFSDNTTLLVQSVKGKMNDQGEITDNKTLQDLLVFIDAYKTQIDITCG